MIFEIVLRKRTFYIAPNHEAWMTSISILSITNLFKGLLHYLRAFVHSHIPITAAHPPIISCSHHRDLLGQ